MSRDMVRCNGCDGYFEKRFTAAFRDTDNYDDAYYCKSCLLEIIEGIATE